MAHIRYTKQVKEVLRDVPVINSWSEKLMQPFRINIDYLKCNDDAWQVDRVAVHGYILKKDGTPGKVESERHWYTSQVSKSPDFVRELVELHFPSTDY